MSSVNTAMLVDFSLSVDFDVEDGYRNLELLIFGAGSNYIKVFARLKWNVVPCDALDEDDGLKSGCKYTEGITGWILLSDHDSCWRSDGVGNLLFTFRQRLSSIEWLHAKNGWFTALKLDHAEIDALRSLWQHRTYQKISEQEFKFPARAKG
jgi:hypothetical protein